MSDVRIAGMNCFLGVDIGSVCAKLSLIEEDGRVVHHDVQKVTSNARAAVNSLLTTLGRRYHLGDIAAAGITG